MDNIFLNNIHYWLNKHKCLDWSRLFAQHNHTCYHGSNTRDSNGPQANRGTSWLWWLKLALERACSVLNITLYWSQPEWKNQTLYNSSVWIHSWGDNGPALCVKYYTSNVWTVLVLLKVLCWLTMWSGIVLTVHKHHLGAVSEHQVRDPTVSEGYSNQVFGL